MAKRLLSLFLTLVLCFTALPVIASGGEGEVSFTFSEGIVYGGTAADYGDKIIFADEDNAGFLSVRTVGCDDARVICDKSASGINISGERIYFISGGIYSCLVDGSDLRCHYAAGSELKCLYAEDNYIYFLSGDTVYRLVRGKAETLFRQQGIAAFKPVTSNEFLWYANNPDYKYIDQSGAEIYEETQPLYIVYRYFLSTGVNIREQSAHYATSTGETDYEGPYMKVGDMTLPLAEMMPGTYFSKNGGPCTCHNTSIDCVANPPACNCMRFYPTGDASTCEIDLLGCQCFGFARLVFYRCFGFIDHSMFYGDRFHSVGSLSAGSVTASSIKELMMKADTGAHVRLSRGHSVSILTMDDDFITIYHGNAGGDGVADSPCIVSTRRFTWEQFAAWTAQGIAYVNMPNEYPGSTEISGRIEKCGYYRVNYNLNVRAGAGTSFAAEGYVFADDCVNVLECSGVWGRISPDGETNEQWICLDYCTFLTQSGISVADNGFLSLYGDGYLVSGSDRVTYGTLLESLFDQNIIGYSALGKPLADGELVTTGSVINIELGGDVIESRTVLIDGDINRNGYVDVGDYILMKRTFFGMHTPDELSAAAGDIDKDGSITAFDYLLVKSALLNGW